MKLGSCKMGTTGWQARQESKPPPLPLGPYKGSTTVKLFVNWQRGETSPRAQFEPFTESRWSVKLCRLIVIML